jgi:hypothetical protein
MTGENDKGSWEYSRLVFKDIFNKGHNHNSYRYKNECNLNILFNSCLMKDLGDLKTGLIENPKYRQIYRRRILE